MLSTICNYRQVTPGLATSGQPDEQELADIAKAGYDVVLNIALHDDPRYSLGDEEGADSSLGMRYVHILVKFDLPSADDLRLLFVAMEENANAKLWVHCAANRRVSAFLGMYWHIRHMVHHRSPGFQPSSARAGLRRTLRHTNQHFPVMHIEIDDLSRPAVHALLREHLSNMYELSPADKVFALDLSKLRAPEITFWTVWEGQSLLGCGALKELTPKHGEVKSMRTPAHARRMGAGRAVLSRIIETARERGYELLSLETGSHPAFLVAQSLYRSAGFEHSGPFAGYKEDPNSVFMSMRLHAAA